MKTLLDTPEIDGRQVYGVIWELDQDEPYTEYASLDEAKAVAKALGGYLVSRPGWTPLPVEAL